MLKYQKYTALILLLVVCFSIFLPLTAIAGDDLDDDDDDKKFKDKGNAFERAVAKLLGFFPRMMDKLWDKVGFKSMSELVFASGLSDVEKEALPWQVGQYKYVYKFYTGLLILVIPIYTLLIAVSAFKFLNASINPAERAEAKDSVMRIFYGILIMLLAPYLIEVLIKFSLLLVDAIATAFLNIGNVEDLNSLNVNLLSSKNIITGSVLGTVIVKIMFAMLFLYFNILYIIRMVAMSVMFVFTPIMTIFWVINKNTTAIAIWLGELASNAFMPVAHALVLCVVLLLSDVKNVTDGSFVTILVMMYTLIPLSEALRNSMQSIFTRAAGFSEDATAKKVMGVFGGGIAGVAKVGAATIGGGNFKGPKPGEPSTTIPKPGGGSGTSRTTPPKRTPPKRTPVQTSPRSSPSGNTASKGKINNPASSNTRTLPNTKATVRTYNATPRMATKTPTINKAKTAGNIASTAVKLAAIPALAVAGAVPGGQGLVTGGSKIAQGVAKHGTSTLIAGGQIANAYAKTRNLEQSLQQVTGTTDKKQAMTSIINPQKATNYQVPKKFASPQRTLINAKNSPNNNMYRVKTEQPPKLNNTTNIASTLSDNSNNSLTTQNKKYHSQQSQYNLIP